MKIQKTIYQKGKNGCLVLLPGRGGHSSELVPYYSLDEFCVVGLDDEEKQWYPKPNGIKDQKEAIEGLENNRKIIEEELNKIDFPSKFIAIIGYSAGGVAALWTVIKSEKEYGLVMAHSGTILDLENVPRCKYDKLPIVMAHGQKDDVFDYKERFMPAIEVLRNKNYSVCKIKNPNGKHEMNPDDADIVKSIIKFKFTYI